MAYGQCQNIICIIRKKEDNEHLNAVENMAAGSIASVFSSIALCPTELIKCRIQTYHEMEKLNPLNKQSFISKKM